MFDNLIIILCVVVIISVAVHFSKGAQDMDEYYRANRALPWSLVVGTLMASWYGGAGVIGTVGYSTTMGLAAFFIWSIGCHASRFPLALWIAPNVSVKCRGTMPELLRRHYGKFAAVLGSIVLVVTCLSIAEIGATGYVGEGAWGINKFVVAAIIVVLAIGITCLGGLMGVAVTDMIFFVLMITSICMAFPKMFMQVGGIGGMQAAMGDKAPELFTAFGGIPPLQACVLILLCINLYKDPSFYQRFAAANSPKTGKRAMLICFSIFLSFDIINMMNGMIVRYYDFDLATAPELTYVRLVLGNLPAGFRAFFVVGVLGAIISTLDTYYLVGGEIVANDIIYMLRGDRALPGKVSILVSRICCLIFGAIGLAAAFQFDFVYDAFLLLSSLSMGVLFVPLMMAILYPGRKTNVAGTASVVVGTLSWLWFNFNPITLESLGSVDPVLIALPLSFFAFGIGNFFGRDLVDERRKLAEAIKAGDSGKTLSDFDKKMLQEDTYVSSYPKSELKVEWFGIDGALVLLYIVLACIYGYGMLAHVDFIIGYMAPGIASGMAVAIFIKYCTEIYAFATGKKSLHKNK